jgi:aminoglycoside phosphotransferase (APT) family kinase protein
MNSLYTTGDIVLRVGRATAPAVVSHQLVAWIAGHGVRTVTPVDGWAADIDDMAVTAWRRVRETGQAIDWEEVGSMVRRVHDLPVEDVPVGYPVPEPTSFPWWNFDALLNEVDASLDDASRLGLWAAIDRNRWWADAVTQGAVLCHGDVHPGNVLVSGTGPLLIDWDLMCHANPAWDHAMLTTFAGRWGGDPDAVVAFSSGYGRSFVDDPLTLALAELRNVAATLMRVRAGLADLAAATEAERRLRYWRGDPDAPTWHAQ